ncbi:Cell division inhibitor [hydrothermal vent metagenome]|uniref:Cell division inhibitor n=1 Tax=hydrothermal vent metagenome TaxID=652676 RepID=A0A161JVV6_9ZZZZ
MKIYELNKTQYIKRSIEEVFSFFEKAENLALITPEKLAFKILTPTPIVMVKGTLIDYTIRLMGIPIHWRTLITKYNPPHEFVDEQIKGPYKFWHHTHTFKVINGGVEINDSVRYGIPMGVLGQLVHQVWILKNLENIFEYRKAVIDKLFNQSDSRILSMDEYKGATA